VPTVKFNCVLICDAVAVPAAITIALLNEESPRLLSLAPSVYKYNELFTFLAVMPLIFAALIAETKLSSEVSGTVTSISLMKIVFVANVPIIARAVPLTAGKLAVHSWLPTTTQSPALTAAPFA